MSRSSTFYVGRRTLGVGGRRPTNLELSVVGRDGVRPLDRGPEPVDWGAATPGAQALAYALLHDLTGLFPSPELCAALATEVLAGLDQDGFVLAEADLEAWLEEHAAA